MRLKTIVLDIEESISVKSEILNDQMFIQKISDLACLDDKKVDELFKALQLVMNHPRHLYTTKTSF